MDGFFVALGSLAVAGTVGYAAVSAPTDVARPKAVSIATAAKVATPAKTSPPATPSQGLVDWAVLTAYDYQPGLANVSDAVKALDGKVVTMRGFLMPLYEYDDIHEFVLVANHMSCCFGFPAGINGQVVVQIPKGRDGLPNTNEPLEIRGTFHVREKSEAGYVLSIYDIDDASAAVVGYR